MTADSAELPPGYYLDPMGSGAWLTLPWPGDPSLPWSHPDRVAGLPPSLGGQIIDWCETNLVHHLTGQPWEFTGGQRRFLWLWYAVRPDGQWIYRSGVKRGAKGVGKDPLGAALILAEACGPVAVDDWSDGQPVGRPHRLALVQIGANSEGQGRDLLRVVNAMASNDLRVEVGFDPGVLRTELASGSRIELLTNSERSAEGDPATAIILNETQHFLATTGGHDLAGVARRNTAKSPGGMARVLELTNAHEVGEGSVAESSFEAWQLQVSGKTRRSDILYDSREAPPHLSLHVESELEEGIAAAYAESPWTNLERIRDEAQDPRIPVNTSIRFYFNALPTAETAWVDPRAWDACARPDVTVADGDGVVLFLDCSKSSDSTALVGCRVSDGHVFTGGLWQRPHGDRGTGWLAPRVEVHATVAALVARFDVQSLMVDPSPARDDENEHSYWAGLVDEWHRQLRDDLLIWATPGVNGSAVAFDMRLSVPGGRERNRLFTEAAEQTSADVEGSALTHDGDPGLRLHVQNARRRPNQWGVSLGKASRGSSKLVDLAVAMVGARMARRVLLNTGKSREKKRTGRAVFV